MERGRVVLDLLEGAALGGGRLGDERRLGGEAHPDRGEAACQDPQGRQTPEPERGVGGDEGDRPEREVELSRGGDRDDRRRGERTPSVRAAGRLGPP